MLSSTRSGLRTALSAAAAGPPCNPLRHLPGITCRYIVQFTRPAPPQRQYDDLQQSLRGQIASLTTTSNGTAGDDTGGAGDRNLEEEATAPGVVDEYDEREMALQSMLYPGMIPTPEEMIDQTHVPVIKDPWQNKGRFHRCRGKKQGKGALEGTCEIFNAKELHVNHTPLLKSFLSEAATILPRSRTGLCAKCQRKIARTVRRSRQMGLLPIIDDFEIRDTGPGGLRSWAVGANDGETPEQRTARLRPKQKRFGSLA